MENIKKTNRQLLLILSVYFFAGFILTWLQVNQLLVLIALSLFVCICSFTFSSQKQVFLPTQKSWSTGLVSGLLIFTLSFLTTISGQENQTHVLVQQYSPITAVLSLIIVPAFTEELLFRGFVYNQYRKKNNLCAILLSAVLFGLMHSGLNAKIYGFTAGLILAIVVAYTNSIWAAIIAHGTANCLTYITAVIDLQVNSADFRWINIGTVIIAGFGSVVALIYLLKGQKIQREPIENIIDWFSPALIFVVAIIFCFVR